MSLRSHLEHQARPKQSYVPRLSSCIGRSWLKMQRPMVLSLKPRRWNVRWIIAPIMTWLNDLHLIQSDLWYKSSTYRDDLPSFLNLSCSYWALRMLIFSVYNWKCSTPPTKFSREVKTNGKIANCIELQNSVNVRFADFAIVRLLFKHRTRQIHENETPHDNSKCRNATDLGVYGQEFIWSKFWIWTYHHSIKIFMSIKASAPFKRPHERRYPWGLWELIQTLNSPLEIRTCKTDSK